MESSNAFIVEQNESLRRELKYQSTENAEFFASFYKNVDQIISSLDQFKTRHHENEKQKNELNQQSDELIRKRDKLKDNFASEIRELNQQIQKESGVQNIQLDDFLNLNKTITNAEEILTQINKEQKNRKAIQQELFTALKSLESIWKQEYDQI